MRLPFIILYVFFPVSWLFSQASSSRSKQAVRIQTPVLQEAFQKDSLVWGSPIFIRIFKESKELEVWVKNTNNEEFTLFKTYSICTYGSLGLGPKMRQGDGKAPEGFYFVNARRLNPNSNFHLSFNLGYPNTYDRYHGKTGNYLMVHGSCVSIGCYAMTDSLIEEIYTLAQTALQNGQPFFRVHAFPFRMTKVNMEKYLRQEQYRTYWDFWKNLKDGYDYFEKMHYPPNVNIRNGNYILD